MCNREESRTGEAIFRTIMKPFNSMLGGSSGSISTELLAAGMLKVADSSLLFFILKSSALKLARPAKWQIKIFSSLVLNSSPTNQSKS